MGDKEKILDYFSIEEINKININEIINFQNISLELKKCDLSKRKEKERIISKKGLFSLFAIYVNQLNIKEIKKEVEIKEINFESNSNNLVKTKKQKIIIKGPSEIKEETKIIKKQMEKENEIEEVEELDFKFTEDEKQDTSDEDEGIKEVFNNLKKFRLQK